MRGMNDWITAVLVASLLASILLPLSISNFLGADQSGWDAQTIALWAIIPIILVIALVIKLLKGGGLGAKS